MFSLLLKHFQNYTVNLATEGAEIEVCKIKGTI